MAEAGDYVEVHLTRKIYEGVLLEAPKDEKGIVLLKLNSGYNIGLIKKDVQEIKVLKKGEDKEEDLVVHRDKAKPNIGMIITEDNKHEVKPFIRFWKRRLKGLKGVEIRTVISHDWAAQVSNDEVLHRKGSNFVFKNVCHMPFTVMTIFSNGDVGACCMDVAHRIIIGNAKCESLASIWRGSKARELRKAMKSYTLDSFAPCRDCIEYNMSMYYLLEKTLFSLKRKISTAFGHLFRF